MKYDTLALHTGVEIDRATGSSSVPIYQASTFHQSEWGAHQEFDYSRSGNPTRQALEHVIAQLEGGTHGFAFASGMAAISSALLLYSAGDHIIASDNLYGGTFRVLTQILSRLGIESTFVDASDLDAVEAAIRSNTKALFLETPSNPTLQITDLQGAAVLAKKYGLQTLVDNTLMTPYLQRPHELGIDVVIYSATKFLGGHSDVLAGLVTVKEQKLAREIYRIQNGFGAVLGPQDSWLLMRGIKTLPVRLRQSQQTAGDIAEYLHKHPKVPVVWYPNLASHPGKELHLQQAAGGGAVVSFDLGSADNVQKFVKNITLPLFAVSLGAVESILSYPATMSHAAMPAAERNRRGIGDGLLRLSVGLEHSDDLLQDIEQALKAL